MISKEKDVIKIPLGPGALVRPERPFPPLRPFGPKKWEYFDWFKKIVF